ncbi:glycoside hydrolase family 43 protein [Marasmius fiardii PR-910]|nr:glycoside hydrolase family 43 protein [Marasmius fiardii PR-910]
MMFSRFVQVLLLSLFFTSVIYGKERWHTTATYKNINASIAADPHVRWDEKTKQYWVYSTDGADEGWHFAIYTSPDLGIWRKLPGGAIKADATSKLWADDWFWAPECYYNEQTGWYFLFYAGRMLNGTNVASHFKYPDFEEASKVGVAVSRSPQGPFVNIDSRPIDYYPFDPNYNDVNLIMSPPYFVPPESLAEGQKAPKGTYIPFIDPNVLFDYGKGGELSGIYLFFSRNAYRNWIWDEKYGKYVEESNIYVVRLDEAWWLDLEAKTMPGVHSEFRNVNQGKAQDWQRSVNESFPGPDRMDGWISIISRSLQPQIWEDAHVYDYSSSNGTKKDRRWSEGSTTIKRFDSFGQPVYFLTYSSNNFESVDYGVGYAFSTLATGPYTKSDSNPILSQDASRSICSTGHGSIIPVKGNIQSNEFYYTYHARSSPEASRSLYNARLFIDPDELYVGFGSNWGDIRVPTGVAPLKMEVNPSTGGYQIEVKNADGALFNLDHPGNRVRVLVSGREVETQIQANGLVNVNVTEAKAKLGVNDTGVTFRYQRAKFNLSEAWADVKQFEGAGNAEEAEFVEVVVSL